MATNHLPEVSIIVAPSSPSLVISPGTPLNFVGTATDSDGDLKEHWMEIQNPAGEWSWQGWLSGEPWEGALVGDKTKSVKAATFIFNDKGTWHVRTTANDDAQPDQWQVSNEIEITVTDAPHTTPTEPTAGASVSVNGGTPVVATVGAVLTLQGEPVYTFDKEGAYAIQITPPEVVVITPPVDVPPVTTDPVDPPATGDSLSDWPMDAASISARLGPKWLSGPEDRQKKTVAVTQQAPAGTDPRIANFEYGKILPRWNNFWSTTINGLVSRAGKVIPFRAQAFAAYAGAAATAARPDVTGFIPDPDLTWAPVDGIATSVHRSQSCVCNEAIVGTLSGNITSLGTQTGADAGVWRPVLNIPNFSVTAVCSLSQNEMIFAVGFNPVTKKSQIAFIGAEAKYLGSHTMHAMCQPCEGSWSALKLLGMMDLPFDWPSACSAASNGQWIGPSQTANQDLGQIDMTKSWTRDSMRDEGENDNTPWGWIFATKGIVVVTSKKAGKTAVIDISKFLYQVRQDYCGHDDAAYEAIIAAELKGDYPKTFAETPDLAPTIQAVYDTPLAQAALVVPKMERWSDDYYKAFVGSEDGTLYTIDVSPLLSRYSWQSKGPGGIIAKQSLGGNITHLTWFRYDDDWPAKPLMPNKGTAFGYCNTLVATIRDKRLFRFVWSWREQGGTYRDISSVNGDDPIASYMDARTGELIGFYADGIITFTIGGVSVPVVDSADQSWYPASDPSGIGENPKLEFEGGDFIICGNDENVN